MIFKAVKKSRNTISTDAGTRAGTLKEKMNQKQHEISTLV